MALAVKRPMTRNQAGVLAALLSVFSPPRPPSKSAVRRWDSSLTPKRIFRVVSRRRSDVEAVTDNLLAEHREHNAASPRYHRRTENPRKLRRLARKMIAAVTAVKPVASAGAAA